MIAAVILQTSFFSYLSILGATPYLVPVVIVALGLLGGAVVGAVSGFAAGFLLDSMLLQTLGVSSLVLLSIGYLAGRYREGFEFKGLGVPALLAGGFTLLGHHGLRRDRARPRRRRRRSACSWSARSSSSRCWRSLLGFAVYPLCHRILRDGADRLPARAAEQAPRAGRACVCAAARSRRARPRWRRRTDARVRPRPRRPARHGRAGHGACRSTGGLR